MLLLRTVYPIPYCLQTPLPSRTHNNCCLMLFLNCATFLKSTRLLIKIKPA